MTIKNQLGILSAAASPALAPALGQDFDFWFGFDSSETDIDSFFLDFTAPSGATSWDLAFDTETYQEAPPPAGLAGDYQANSPQPPGVYQTGTARFSFLDGWGLAFDTTENYPFGRENVTLDLDFSLGSYIVESFPPPVSWDLEFDAETYQESGDPALSTPSPLWSEPLMYVEEIVIDRPDSDVLGGVVLGQSTIGGGS